MVGTEVLNVAALAAFFFVSSTVNRKPGKYTFLQKYDLHCKILNDR